MTTTAALPVGSLLPYHLQNCAKNGGVVGDSSSYSTTDYSFSYVSIDEVKRGVEHQPRQSERKFYRKVLSMSSGKRREVVLNKYFE